MWFRIALGRGETTSGIVPDAPAIESPVSFRITTWNAAESRWQVTCEVKGNHAPVDVVFPAMPTQFISLQLLAASDTPWTIHRAHVLREMDTWLGASRTR